jgi:hypothetical protein
MTTRLEVRRLSTPRRNGAGRAERRREIWGITTPRTVTPGSIGRRCSGFLSCSFGPQRLPLDRSDAAGAFVEPAEATPPPLRQGEAPPARVFEGDQERQLKRVGEPKPRKLLGRRLGPSGSRARAPGGRSRRRAPASSTLLSPGRAAPESVRGLLQAEQKSLTHFAMRDRKRLISPFLRRGDRRERAAAGVLPPLVAFVNVWSTGIALRDGRCLRGRSISMPRSCPACRARIPTEGRLGSPFPLP